MQNNLELANKAPKISVVIRKRPLSQKEQAKSDEDIIDIVGTSSVIVKEMKQKVDLTKYIEEHNFNFDWAFGENSNNHQIYQACVKPLVQAAFTNATVTCFAYGQTGSGKTHTMLGNYERGNPGLYLLAAEDLFNLLQTPQFQNLTVWVSFYEIYCGKLFDLLNERKELPCREDAKKRVNIVGLQEKRITDVQTIMNIIEFGNKVRVTGVNGANSESSRSHAILSITLKQDQNTFGKLSFIDLAGSERGADVKDSNKQTRIDGAEINKSLLSLKECIRAIDQNKNHTPFRGSKLTQVLRDSFVGNCRTVMIGNIAPCQSNSENTLNTLRYADRVKELKKPGESGGGNQNLTELEKMQKELMLPRQNNNTKKYSVPNENAYIDYTKQGMNPGQNVPQQLVQPSPPLSQQEPSNLFNHNQNHQNVQNNQFNNQNNFGNQNNQLNSIDLQLQHKLSQKRQNLPQTQNLFNTNNNNQNNMNQYGQVNNTTNNNSFMNNNNLNSLNNMNSAEQNQNKMEEEDQYNVKKNNFMGQQINSQPQQLNYNQNINNNFNNNPNLIQNQFQRKINPIQNNSNLMQNNLQYQQQNNNQSEEELQKLSQKHESLISQILAEEEEVIAGHRSHIDDMVDLVKKEMMLLHEVDKPGSDVDDYVQNLDQMLAHKVNIITNLRQRLKNFRDHLKEEEQLSKKFYEQRNQMLDVYDINQQNSNMEMGNTDEQELLEGL